MEAATYAALLRNAERKRPRDPAIEAADLVQTAWMKALPAMADVMTETDELKLVSYNINQVAIDHARAHLRRMGLGTTVSLEEWHAVTIGIEREVLARIELQGILDDIAAGDALAAAALATAYWGVHEGAERTGVPRQTLSTRTHRFRAKRKVA